MDAKPPPPAPSSGANAGSVRNSPFAYQTRMLERSSSRSSTQSFSLAEMAQAHGSHSPVNANLYHSSPSTATAAATSPPSVPPPSSTLGHGSTGSLSGLGGLHHAGSVRRYHGGASRATGSLDVRAGINALNLRDGSTSPSKLDNGGGSFSSSTAASAIGSAYSQQFGGAGNGTVGSNYTAASSVTPSLASYKLNNTSAVPAPGLGNNAGSISSRSRPFSMPPAPRDGSGIAPISPTRGGGAGGSGAGIGGSYLPPRSASPTKLAHSSVFGSPVKSSSPACTAPRTGPVHRPN